MERIYFQTHGCSTNVSETEVMQGLLNKAGFAIVDEPQEADILIINICTVKGEETAIREIRKLSESYLEKKLIVAGCITRAIIKEARKIREDASLIDTHNINKIVEVVEEVINDNAITAMGRDEYIKINFPKIRKNPVVGIIPILNSCANYCSYCSVRYVKGKLFSYPTPDIIAEARKAVEQGCRELWITSQDNAAYMLEKEQKTKLPELVNCITAIDGKFFVRIGMMNPKHLLEVLGDMIEVYKNEKVFKFLHVPVQSGNDKILELMKRGYKIEDFRRIISEFKKNIPDITISTDIICGFPTETEEQFQDSINLIREIKPSVLNISRFQPRPGTEAAEMKGQIDGGTTKDRSRLLTEIFANISRMSNEQWLNWEGKILIDEKGKDDSWIGRNSSYKPVIVKRDVKLGDFVNVKISNSAIYDLRGEVY